MNGMVEGFGVREVFVVVMEMMGSGREGEREAVVAVVMLRD